MKYYLLIFLLMSCASRQHDQEINVLKNEGYSLVIGCMIYDLDGNLQSSYPGEECVFMEDGSFLSYDSKIQVLTKYDRTLKSLWKLNLHVHHGIKLLSNGDIIINSSIIKDHNNFKKVRFSNVVIISQEGKIKKSFSFFDHLNEVLKNSKRPVSDIKPYPANWDQNIDFDYEYTHLAGTYEVKAPLMADGKVFAPEGSFLLTFNSIGRGVYVLSPDIDKVINYKFLSNRIFHDIQPFSGTEVIFFVNTHKDQEAHVVIQDLSSGKPPENIYSDMFAYFAGAVQPINQDLFLVSDSKSTKGTSESKDESYLSVEERVKLSDQKFGRLLFINRSGRILRELNFEFRFQSGRMQNLKSFLQKNIRL